MVRAIVAEAMAKEDPGQTMFTLFKVGRFDQRNVTFVFHNLIIKDFFSYYRGKKNPFPNNSNRSRKWALMAKENDLFNFTSRGRSCWAGLEIADSVRAYLHGTTLSHATSLRQAYDTNCFV